MRTRHLIFKLRLVRLEEILELQKQLQQLRQKLLLQQGDQLLWINLNVYLVFQDYNIITLLPFPFLYVYSTIYISLLSLKFMVCVFLCVFVCVCMCVVWIEGESSGAMLYSLKDRS